jgi:hypothetical protein
MPTMHLSNEFQMQSLLPCVFLQSLHGLIINQRGSAMIQCDKNKDGFQPTGICNSYAHMTNHELNEESVDQN